MADIKNQSTVSESITNKRGHLPVVISITKLYDCILWLCDRYKDQFNPRCNLEFVNTSISGFSPEQTSGFGILTILPSSFPDGIESWKKSFANTSRYRFSWCQWYSQLSKFAQQLDHAFPQRRSSHFKRTSGKPECCWTSFSCHAMYQVSWEYHASNCKRIQLCYCKPWLHFLTKYAIIHNQYEANSSVLFAFLHNEFKFRLIRSILLSLPQIFDLI